MPIHHRSARRHAVTLVAAVSMVPIVPILPDPEEGHEDEHACDPGADEVGTAETAPTAETVPTDDVECADEGIEPAPLPTGDDEPSPADDDGDPDGDVGDAADDGDTDGDMADDSDADDAEDGDDAESSGGLRAEEYAGVYARGLPLWTVVATTALLGADGPGSITNVPDARWNGFGGHARAVDAPPEVHEQFLYEVMAGLVEQHGTNLSAIPVAWYHPPALGDPALMNVVPEWAGEKGLTVSDYQRHWLKVFDQQLIAGAPVRLPPDPDPLVPSIAFPVLGPTTFWDDWHAPRDGGARKHEGLDFMGKAGQPLRAAFDGVVTRLRPNDTGLPGVGITITRADGLRANYFHLDADLRWHPSLDVGDRVRAGQVIAFMGATGNAWEPHLHFELRTPDGEPMAPYPATQDAIQREQCTVGIGPWSTLFESPAEVIERIEQESAIEVADVEAVDSKLREVIGPDGARWAIARDGAVTASGRGALVAPVQGACSTVPTDEYGSDAAGVSVDLLPDSWWGDEVAPADLEAMIAAVAAERSQEFDLDGWFDMVIGDEVDPLSPRISSMRPPVGNRAILGAVTWPAPGDPASSD